jgi:RND family efflux transporter MFP subunit
MTTLTDNLEAISARQRVEGLRPRNSLLKNLLMLLTLCAALAAIGIAIRLGIKSRVTAEDGLAAATLESAVPFVRVTHPQPDSATKEISLPGNTQAYVDSPIYARTDGYLKSWFHDIGARVKKGDLLAVIETPEVDQQLWQARADLETAKANAVLADVTSKRYVSLQATGATSQEQIDTAVDTYKAQEAAVNANAANVSRLEQLQSFERVIAPFDGVITARYTDVGALIDAGASGNSNELFHMVDDTKLRVFVAVPEIYSSAAQSGAPARLTLDEYPGQSFQGTIVRNSNAIDLTSRTLNVEVDVDNASGKLLTGAYVFVHLKVPTRVEYLTVPANALIFRSQGLQVGVVENGRAELRNIKLGRDYGTRVEVVSGLNTTDSIILDPMDSLTGGTAVRVRDQSASSQ